MIKVNYTELDGPAGPTCRLEASGHAGYAPAGQDIVCAGASTLMQTLCALLAGEEGTRSGVWDEPDGPRLAVTAAAPQKPWVEGAFEFAKAGFALLAERYPDNVRFADLSGRGEQSMVDLQLFASEGGDAAAHSAPTLSHAQAQQAIASGTMKADEGREASDVPTPAAVQEPEERPAPPEQGTHGMQQHKMYRRMIVIFHIEINRQIIKGIVTVHGHIIPELLRRDPYRFLIDIRFI